MGFIRDNFFGGNERRAADAQVAAGDSATIAVDNAQNFANDALAPFSDVGRQTAGDLIDSARGTPAADQAADFDAAAATPADSTFLDKLRERIATPPREAERGGFENLRDFISRGPEDDLERTEGFKQIQQSAAAGGRLGAGGTLRDLVRFNSSLNARRRGDRVSELLALNQAELGRNEEGALNRSRGIGELITGDATVRGARQERLGDLLSRVQVSSG